MLNNRKVKIKTQRVGGGCVETNEDDFFFGGGFGFFGGRVWQSMSTPHYGGNDLSHNRAMDSVYFSFIIWECLILCLHAVMTSTGPLK